MDCTEFGLLVQADLDGELTPAEAARVSSHVANCATCARVESELLAMSASLRDAELVHAIPVSLEDRIRTHLAELLPRDAVRRQPYARRWTAAWFGAGFAVAASFALALLPAADPIPTEVVTSHIRALQPGHASDVASSDQHTVKPWFDGRIDYAPPVKDLAAARFPLLGGRLDYLAGRPVAALVYGRDKHLIDLFVWPDSGAVSGRTGTRSGYNFQRWSYGGMVVWAVSDLNAVELAEFAQVWQAD